ncbi:MAG: methyl-accepting chemotaxis protein [Sulfurifustaceae bacterium]
MAKPAAAFLRSREPTPEPAPVVRAARDGFLTAFLRLFRAWRERNDATLHASTGMKHLLVRLQDLFTRSAVGSARASVRLDSVSTQMKQVSNSLSALVRTADKLHSNIHHVADASQQTLAAAREMNTLSADGRDLSQNAMASSEQLRVQMQATVERIESLVKGIGSVMSVSQVIEEIARQTLLLSFNAAIEAARAGSHGRGFGVVAQEVRALAERTGAQTQEIKALLDKIATELNPAREALLASSGLVENAAHGTQAVGQALERIAELADGTAERMEQVAAAVEAQRGGMDNVFADLKTATAASQGVIADTEALTRSTFAVSELVEESFQQFVCVDTNTPFHRALRACHELSARTRGIFERAVDQGRCRLEDVLAYEYQEIKGPAIRRLERLFDVSRVPPEGFTPPKYHAGYDAAIDLELQAVMDELKSREPALLYIIVVDLNLYGPSHHREYCQPWTGIPEKDVVGNRAKRFFHDKWLSVRGTRVGLGPAAANVPDRASREQFIRAGCRLTEHADSAREFAVKVYGRDTGVVATPIFVPIYVKGHRYGSATAAWKIDT